MPREKSRSKLTKRYYDRWEQIAFHYPILLEDKKRFLLLGKDPEFVEVNERAYQFTTGFFHRINSEKIIEGERILEDYLVSLEHFVERWKTRPVSLWLFRDDDTDLPRECIEGWYEHIGNFETISLKVYPHTVEGTLKNQLEDQYRSIRKKQKTKRFPDLLVSQLQIVALRDAGWPWSEVQEFHYSYAPEMNAYRKALESGQTRTEAEKTAEKAVKATQRNYPKKLPDYEAIRGRFKAAKKYLNRLQNVMCQADRGVIEKDF